MKLKSLKTTSLLALLVTSSALVCALSCAYSKPVQAEEKPVAVAADDEKPIEVRSERDAPRTKLVVEAWQYEETRMWKAEANEDAWLWERNNLSLRATGELPENLLSFGFITEPKVIDNEGNDLSFSEVEGPMMGATPDDVVWHSASHHGEVPKNPVIEVAFKKPSRKAESISVKAAVALRFAVGLTTGKSKLLAEAAGKAVFGGDDHGFTISVKKLADTELEIELSGNQVKIIGVKLIDAEGSEIDNRGSSSSFAMGGPEVRTIYLNGKLPEGACLSVTYAKSIERKNVEIELKDFKLP